MIKKYSGYLTTLYLGVYRDKLEIVFMEDDGTRGKHILFYYNNLPVGMIPLMNESELGNLIGALVRAYKDFGFDEKLLMAKILEKDL